MIFHDGSISLIEEPCKSAHLAAMDIAKKAGCLLSCDPNLRLPQWPSEEAARKDITSHGMKLTLLRWMFENFETSMWNIDAV